MESCNTRTDNMDLQVDQTPIQKFYANTNIFITGCTGFLGTILLEKLLTSCPNISMIYLLVRKKKDKAVKSRMEEMFDQVIFQRLSKAYPDFLEKVSPIEGDCALSDLGICETDKAVLMREVNIIFHVAATVRFDEKLNIAVAINIRATRDLIRLAHQMPHLKSLVHVSTAYSNCVKDAIEEKVYPAPIDYNKLIYMAESVPEKILEKMTPMLVGQNPNTYTYTKQIAEDVVKQEAKQLPVAIYRPSVVCSTYREPIEGWTGNLYGVTGIVVAASVGFLGTMHADPDGVANLIPADMCVNAMIGTAWDVAQTFEKNKDSRKQEIPVYHYESSNDNPITWGRFTRVMQRLGQIIPLKRTLWYYSFQLHKTYTTYLLSVILYHMLPAAIIDAALLIVGKSSRFVKIYLKIHKFSKLMVYFSVKHIAFRSENVQKLISRMAEKDREIFFSDLKELDWDEFLRRYGLGIRRYVAKDPDETIPEAVKRYKRLYWLYLFTKIARHCLVLLILWYVASWVLRHF